MEGFAVWRGERSTLKGSGVEERVEVTDPLSGQHALFVRYARHTPKTKIPPLPPLFLPHRWIIKRKTSLTKPAIVPHLTSTGVSGYGLSHLACATVGLEPLTSLHHTQKPPTSRTRSLSPHTSQAQLTDTPNTPLSLTPGYSSP